MLNFKTILSSLNNIKKTQILMFYDGHLWRKVRTICNNQIYACFGHSCLTPCFLPTDQSVKRRVYQPLYLNSGEGKIGVGGVGVWISCSRQAQAKLPRDNHPTITGSLTLFSTASFVGFHASTRL